MIHFDTVIRLPIELLIVAVIYIILKMLFSTNGRQTLDFVALHVEFVG
jgi:hypothetical protein